MDYNSMACFLKYFFHFAVQYSCGICSSIDKSLELQEN